MRREPNDCGRTTKHRDARATGQVKVSKKYDVMSALAALCALLGAGLGLHDVSAPDPGPARNAVEASPRPDAKPIPTTSVQGTVRSAQGHGIPEATVCASPVATASRVMPNQCVVADGRGGYVFADLSPAAYVVTAAAEGHESGVAHGGQPLRLTGYGAMIGVDVVLRPAEPLSRALDATRSPEARSPHAGPGGDAQVATQVSVRASSRHQGRAPAREGDGLPEPLGPRTSR